MKIKACIFDLDGVIVNTAKYHYLAWKRLARELNFNFTEKDNERLKGVSRMASLDILLSIGGLSFSEDEKLKLAEKKNKWYVEYISKLTDKDILPGVSEFITLLKSSGIKIALGSASKNSMLILKSLNLVPYFDSIIDGTKVTKAKPDPEVFLLAAKELNIDSKNCVVFEDAAAGVEAAKRGNMYAIGVGSPDILKAADKVISGFSGLTLDILNL